MSRSIYIALGYQCNQHCTCCPCGKSKNLGRILSLEDVKNFVVNENYTHFIVSGGEPTLHPDFNNIISFLSNIGHVTILSNSEKFGNKPFASEFLKHIIISKVRLVTTLHSHTADLHEAANLKKGSFNKTVTGLKFLQDSGLKICIKHCITPNNYQNLAKFVDYIYKTFPVNADIQFSGIDYVGMSIEDKQKAVCLGIYEKYVESALDRILQYEKQKILRNVYCLNIPLCHVDPYYWKFFRISEQRIYDSYYSPNFKSVTEFDTDIGCFSKKCLNCDVKQYCMGTYKSAFLLYGDSFVNPVHCI